MDTRGTCSSCDIFQPGTTKLQVATESNSNRNQEKNLVDNLALNVDHEIEMKVVGSRSIVSKNDDIKHTMHVGICSQLSNVNVCIGAPWHSAANTIISDVSFSPAS